jgi:hypothetical protein
MVYSLVIVHLVNVDVTNNRGETPLHLVRSKECAVVLVK